MSTTEGLVPITRSHLSRFYDQYLFDPLAEDVHRLSEELQDGARALMQDSSASPQEESAVRQADAAPPHKIDENLWRNREHIEEILHMLESSKWPMKGQETPEEFGTVALIHKVKVKLQQALGNLESFQARNADAIFTVVMTYMPQDFRCTLIRQQRERSERNRQDEVDSLIKSGGSIHDKYLLLWKQQMERRTQLAQLGSATGVYKALVKYLVGVPQVLLDFIRQINDEDGPMEEQRVRYGPPLYSLTAMIVRVRLLVVLLWRRAEAVNLHKEKFNALEQAVDVYTSELNRFLIFIGEVIRNSPFFISAEDACATESRKNDDLKELVIPAGKSHEVVLTVDSLNSYISWEFSLIQGKISVDIGFHLEHVSPTGDLTMILPYKRYESHQGNFCTCLAGTYRLIWDNAYSNFLKKTLRYKIDVIPPVPAEPTFESTADI